LNGRGGRGSGHARPGNVAAGQDESTIVQLDEVAAPLCASRRRSLRGRPRRDLFTLAGPDVLERHDFQAGLAVAAGNSGAEPDSDVGVAFSWVMR
jgi:hypothetical protein